MKKCTVCKEEKAESEFYKRRASKDNLQSSCKTCSFAKNKQCYNPKTYRKYHFKKLYGITLDDYDKMFMQQNGTCAICGSNDPAGRWGRFCVDHDHKTDKIRALLCNGCNQGLGYFNDNPELLEKAAHYTRTFQGFE